MRVLAPGDDLVPHGAVGRYRLDVTHGFVPSRIEHLDDHVVVESESESLRARIVVVVETSCGGAPPFEVDPAIADRVHRGPPDVDVTDHDVLLVGGGDQMVDIAEGLLASGARLVVAFDGSPDDLSPVARERLIELEHQRRATVLWHSVPSAVGEIGGHPMAYFADRRTPDLQFDHVVALYSTGRVVSGADRGLYRIDAIAGREDPLGPVRAWATICDEQASWFPPPVPSAAWAASREVEQLRLDNYNATITHFEHSHEDLWVIRVRPDVAEWSHRPGQYTTLGLGYWEPRVDNADEGLTEKRRYQLIRRSYSISSRIFDRRGYLTDAAEEDEIEFYIVHVRPNGDRVPGLTPRLAAKRVGDRVFLGPKMAGRYTLDPVVDPETDVVFLATGTGEAPHNAMITELFRKGHRGAVVSIVTVRFLRDLGYLETHRTLERHRPNYRYMPLATREPDMEKRYVQDVVRTGELAGMLDHGLHPERTHVYLCGNPTMIGLPAWGNGRPTFPEPQGVVELLHGKGFSIDRRGVVGAVHYEEYW